MNNVILAFILTLFAGLSTGIGSALVFFTKKTNTRFLSVSLGFSAGVMIYVSFIEILPEAEESLIAALGNTKGEWFAIASFFLGILIIGVIDKLVPDFENPHHAYNKKALKEIRDNKNPENNKNFLGQDSGLLRMGTMSALAITIHNFPEGIATFVSALNDPGLGLTIALAIAIHNIPEGVSVSIPIFYATGNKKKAFVLSFLSGLAEPLGAVVGFMFLKIVLNEMFFGIIFGAVAGIMVFISIDELLPSSRKYGKGHQEIYGFVAGMLVMAISLILM